MLKTCSNFTVIIRYIGSPICVEMDVEMLWALSQPPRFCIGMTCSALTCTCNVYIHHNSSRVIHYKRSYWLQFMSVLATSCNCSSKTKTVIRKIAWRNHIRSYPRGRFWESTLPLIFFPRNFLLIVSFWESR